MGLYMYAGRGNWLCELCCVAAAAAVLRACKACIMDWVHQHLYTVHMMHAMLLLYIC
jgi:hypothetical protein